MSGRVDYTEAMAFVAAVGTPKRRKLSERKPGQPTGPAPLWVTTRTATGRALIRGKLVGRLVDFAGVAAVAEWSVSAAGFVVPAEALGDVVAAAHHLRSPVRFRDLDEDGNVSEWRRWGGDRVVHQMTVFADVDAQLALFGGEVA